MEDELTKQ